MHHASEHPLVSVLWVTRNRWPELQRSILSVLRQTYKPLELVVVDNASSDGTPERLRAEFPSARLVRLHRNLGCPSARNVGFANCGGRYVYSLDDDGWLHLAAIERAVEIITSRPHIGAAVSTVVLLAGELTEKLDGDSSSLQPQQVRWFLGCCTLFSHEVFTQCGGFPDDFFRQSEEEDLALRMLAQGWETWSCPESVMFHRPSLSGRMPLDNSFLMLRNVIRTAYRLIPWPYWPAKVALQCWHALRLAWRARRPTFAARVWWNAILDARFLLRRSLRVSRPVYRRYLRLPSPHLPDWSNLPGAR